MGTMGVFRVTRKNLRKGLQLFVAASLGLTLLFLAHPSKEALGEEHLKEIMVAHAIHEPDVSQQKREEHREEHRREEVQSKKDKNETSPREQNQPAESNNREDHPDQKGRNFTFWNIVGVTGTVMLIIVLIALLFLTRF